MINKSRIIKSKVIDHTECEECNDDYLFKMKDKYHEFYMPLRSILECLWMAEKEGIIPESSSNFK